MAEDKEAGYRLRELGNLVCQKGEAAGETSSLTTEACRPPVELADTKGQQARSPQFTEDREKSPSPSPPENSMAEPACLGKSGPCGLNRGQSRSHKGPDEHPTKLGPMVQAWTSTGASVSAVLQPCLPEVPKKGWQPLGPPHAASAVPGEAANSPTELRFAGWAGGRILGTPAIPGNGWARVVGREWGKPQGRGKRL
uniref:Uncharacterized protein n=1 Tax=Sphaerodactylus townsendi TaxID=933632 RepID=A0ACB8GCP0_9SAUR